MGNHHVRPEDEEARLLSRFAEAFQVQVYEGEVINGQSGLLHLDFSKIVSANGRNLVTDALRKSGDISDLYLILPEGGLPEETLDFLTWFVANKKSLTSINLSKNRTRNANVDRSGYDRCATKIVEAIAENRNIRQLEVDLLANATRSCPGLFHSLLFLQHLTLSNVSNHFDGNLISQLIQNPKCHLVRLDIGGDVEEKTLMPILTSLEKNGYDCCLKHLSLSLRGNENASKCFRLLSNHLDQIKSLTALTIFGPHGNRPEADEHVLGNGLLKNYNLCSIDLYGFSDRFESLSNFIVRRNQVNAMMSSPLFERVTTKDKLLDIISAYSHDEESGLSLVYFVMQKNVGVVFGDRL